MMYREVETKMIMYNRNISGWNQPFNKVSFINNDPTNNVLINSIPVLPGKQLVIPLNVDEVNVTDFTFDFGSSTTAQLLIIWTAYPDRVANEKTINR